MQIERERQTDRQRDSADIMLFKYIFAVYNYVSVLIVWNALPDYLRNPTLSIYVFNRYLKTFLFAQY